MMLNKTSPIFILSSERSGSNLLRSLVSNHSNIEGPIAPHFLDSFWGILSCYGDLKIKKNVSGLFNDMLKLANHPFNNWNLELDFDYVWDKYQSKSFLELFDIFYREKARSVGKKCYLCKSIHIFNYVFPIISRFPDSKFIYLYRDPRDHVASWMKKPLFIKTPYDAVIKWNKEQDVCHSLIVSHNLEVFCVKYEYLMSDTPRIMSNLLGFLEESVEERCFNTDIVKNKDVTWNKYWENLSKPVMKDNKKKYPTVLNAYTIEMIETIAEKNIKRLGYDFETNRNWIKPLFFNRRLKANRKYVSLKNRKNINEDMEKLNSKIRLLKNIQKRAKANLT